MKVWNLFLLLLFSCTNNKPSVVGGIKLGEPLDEPKVKADLNIESLSYPIIYAYNENTDGSITYLTDKKGGGEDFISYVTVRFGKKQSNYFCETCIGSEDINVIITSLKNKYGKPSNEWDGKGELKGYSYKDWEFKSYYVHTWFNHQLHEIGIDYGLNNDYNQPSKTPPINKQKQL